MVDIYYSAIWLFSIAFFSIILYKTYTSVKSYMKKEKELNEMDEKFEGYKSHRQNLLVTYQANATAPLLLELGKRRKANGREDKR